MIKIVTSYILDAQMYKTLQANVIFFAFFRLALSTACLSLSKSQSNRRVLSTTLSHIAYNGATALRSS